MNDLYDTCDTCDTYDTCTTCGRWIIDANSPCDCTKPKNYKKSKISLNDPKIIIQYLPSNTHTYFKKRIMYIVAPTNNSILGNWRKEMHLLIEEISQGKLMSIKKSNRSIQEDYCKNCYNIMVNITNL